VHSEVYLNKYVVSIAPFSTPAFTSTPIQKTALFACFRFLIFHPFSRGSADPICPYVRTPIWLGPFQHDGPDLPTRPLFSNGRGFTFHTGCCCDFTTSAIASLFIIIIISSSFIRSK